MTSAATGMLARAGRPATVGMPASRWLHSYGNYFGFEKKNISQFCKKEETLNFVKIKLFLNIAIFPFFANNFPRIKK
jgi:hypothetical protein